MKDNRRSSNMSNGAPESMTRANGRDGIIDGIIDEVFC